MDSLDTLWIIGMMAEFDEAVAAAAGINFTRMLRQNEEAPMSSGLMGCCELLIWFGADQVVLVTLLP